MKVFITEYALTTGIREVNAEKCEVQGFINWIGDRGIINYAHGEGVGWHTTIESAINKACDMRIRKIASLEKQIEKLRKLEFKQ